MPACTRCRHDFALYEINPQTGRCERCDYEVVKALDRFQAAFKRFASDAELTADEQNRLRAGLQQEAVAWHEAMTRVRDDALELLERALTFSAADGIISSEEERAFYAIINFLQLPHTTTQPYVERLNYLKGISAVRTGVLPTVGVRLKAEPDARVYLLQRATYWLSGEKSAVPVRGQVAATAHHLHFFAASNSWSARWGEVLRIDRDIRGVYLLLKGDGPGSGYYEMEDALLAEAVLTTAWRRGTNQRLAPSSGPMSRSIPLAVKMAVWERDGGRCVQCGAQEDLHFRFLRRPEQGGQPQADNLQLVCGDCFVRGRVSG
jgi:tellurite resistance protein